ncbi:UBN2_3 domain-containing protein [Cucumis melo var. makuwa]|uniref:UBN2_3 domain-containing protein n=1 Tax=Cucumis melo var. makuwa TaxID=1194695 RepID=A0A5A7UBM2_CUCMM|nr:UBN2_3 domain-containing protein [Cucumis melo var. makuwa]TYK03812.1 UBN2_3 domain-containing protein [Cucumis melo var. makuwa]
MAPSFSRSPSEALNLIHDPSLVLEKTDSDAQTSNIPPLPEYESELPPSIVAPLSEDLNRLSLIAYLQRLPSVQEPTPTAAYTLAANPNQSSQPTLVANYSLAANPNQSLHFLNHELLQTLINPSHHPSLEILHHYPTDDRHLYLTRETYQMWCRPNLNQKCTIPLNNNWLCFNSNLQHLRQLLELLQTPLILAFQPMSRCIPRIRDGIQYSRIEVIHRIYDFLDALNLKFDVVLGRILGQRPIPFLMEVCSDVRLEEDHTSAMNTLPVPAIDSVVFNVRSSTHDSKKHNGKSIPICEHCKKSGIPRNVIGNYMVVPQEVRNSSERQT